MSCSVWCERRYARTTTFHVGVKMVPMYVQKVRQLNDDYMKKLESMVQKEVHDFKVPLNGALLNIVNNSLKNGAIQD